MNENDITWALNIHKKYSGKCYNSINPFDSKKQPGEIPRCGDIYIRKANDLKKQLANHDSGKEKDEILEAIRIFESTLYYKNTID